MFWKATIAQMQMCGTAHTEFVICDQSIDTNHGYGKTPVINSEVSKKRAALEKRLNSIKQWAVSARERSHRASLRYTRLWKETKTKGEERYRVLDKQLQALEVQGISPGQWKVERNRLQAEAESEMAELWQRVYRVLDKSNKEHARWERYCREQCDLLRALEDLAAQERTMYELDVRPVQPKLAIEARGKLARERTLITDNPM
jgi:hypothetical protein